MGAMGEASDERIARVWSRVRCGCPPTGAGRDAGWSRISALRAHARDELGEERREEGAAGDCSGSLLSGFKG
jgi:hypothetical protein